MKNVIVRTSDKDLAGILAEQLSALFTDVKLNAVVDQFDVLQLISQKRYLLMIIAVPDSIPVDWDAERDFIINVRQSIENRFLPMLYLTSEQYSLPSEQQAIMGVTCASQQNFLTLASDILTMLTKSVGRQTRANGSINLNHGGESRVLHEDDVFFVEYSARRIVIHTRNEVIPYKYMPLQKFCQHLSPRFLQVHQSYVVNRTAIRSANKMTNMIKLTGCPNQIPIGRSYRKTVFEKMNEK